MSQSLSLVTNYKPVGIRCNWGEVETKLKCVINVTIRLKYVTISLLYIPTFTAYENSST